MNRRKPDTLAYMIQPQRRTKYRADGALHSVELWPRDGYLNFWCSWTMGALTWRLIRHYKIATIGDSLEKNGIDWRSLEWEASPSNYYPSNPFSPDTEANKQSFVYFIQAETGGLIKIGCSTDPESRLYAIQLSCPLPLRFIGMMPGGRNDEAERHFQFDHLRKYGEWFEPGPDLLEYIKTHTIDVLTR